jgi:putative addiction module component (TIGR02574 family)
MSIERDFKMDSRSNRIIEDAMSLPADLRLRLVDALLESLNRPVDPEIDRYWAEEAERRVSEIETGQVRLIPAKEVFEKKGNPS